jgi:hypothetical protein
MKYLEWSDTEKAKRIEVLEKKYEDVLDLNIKEYEEAQQEVSENQDAHLTSHVLGALSGLATFVQRQVHGHPGANKPHQAAAQMGL